MDLSLLHRLTDTELDQVREMIRASLASDIALLNQANGTMLEGGGKMIRPRLAILVAKACSGGHVTEDTLRFAAAAELMHNATLLHDDVVDASPMRRGKPTVSAVMGGRASVLLGDFWLVKAVARILQARNNAETAVRIFAKTLSDLAEGEMLQLQKAASGDTVETDYLRIIYGKTASLFEATAMTAALSVGADSARKKAVCTYAQQVGTAFQIKDDIFDYQDGANIGKPVGQDLLEQKITLPLLGAFAQAPEQEAAVRKQIAAIHQHPEYQAEIVRYVRENGGIAYAQRKLGEYVERACIVLREFPSGEAREGLRTLAAYVADREL